MPRPWARFLSTSRRRRYETSCDYVLINSSEESLSLFLVLLLFLSKKRKYGSCTFVSGEDRNINLESFRHSEVRREIKLSYSQNE